MLGLVLEGGGAKGAYQVGAVKALLESGLVFQGIVGTSIGAINGAVIAQDEFQVLEEVWRNLGPESIFLETELELMKAVAYENFTGDFITQMPKTVKQVLEQGGVDKGKMMDVIKSMVNEDKLRDSKKIFGLTTISLTERKGLELFKEDIPEGKMTDYIMASACLPGFKSMDIEGELFLDGGFFNLSPVNMLLEKGFDEIIVIDIKGPGIRKVVLNPKANIQYIKAKVDLGSTLSFTPERIALNMKLGYIDGMNFIKKTRGLKK